MKTLLVTLLLGLACADLTTVDVSTVGEEDGVCMCMCAFGGVCVCLCRMCVNEWVCMRGGECACAYVYLWRVCISVCVGEFVCMRVCALCVHINVCVRICVYECVCMCFVCACVRTWVYTLGDLSVHPNFRVLKPTIDLQLKIALLICTVLLSIILDWFCP